MAQRPRARFIQFEPGNKRTISMKILFFLGIAAALCPAQNTGYAVTTVAGSYPLGDGGPAIAALLSSPVSAIPDRSGNLFILDPGNARIRKITADGKISTLLQDSTLGFDMKLASAGTIYYIAPNWAVNKIAPGGSPQPFAGTGTAGATGDNGPAVKAQLTAPSALAVDSQGNVYIADGNKIRKVDPSGTIRTIARPTQRDFRAMGAPPCSPPFTKSGLFIRTTPEISTSPTC